LQACSGESDAASPLSNLRPTDFISVCKHQPCEQVGIISLLNNLRSEDTYHEALVVITEVLHRFRVAHRAHNTNEVEIVIERAHELYGRQGHI
jgi:hypothetical protein